MSAHLLQIKIRDAKELAKEYKRNLQFSSECKCLYSLKTSKQSRQEARGSTLWHSAWPAPPSFFCIYEALNRI